MSAQFAVTGGTATPDEDFESTQGVVVFEPGSVEAQVRIPLKDDDLVEGDETVEVTLSDPRNAVLGRRQPQAPLRMMRRYRECRYEHCHRPHVRRCL